MKIRVTYIASIPDEELIEAGINLDDREAIIDFFFDNGGEEAFHDHGEGFEFIR